MGTVSTSRLWGELIVFGAIALLGAMSVVSLGMEGVRRLQWRQRVRGTLLVLLCLLGGMGVGLFSYGAAGAFMELLPRLLGHH